MQKACFTVNEETVQYTLIRGRCHQSERDYFEIFDFKNAVTLKTGLGSVKVIENVTIR